MTFQIQRIFTELLCRPMYPHTFLYNRPLQVLSRPIPFCIRKYVRYPTNDAKVADSHCLLTFT